VSKQGVDLVLGHGHAELKGLDVEERAASERIDCALLPGDELLLLGRGHARDLGRRRELGQPGLGESGGEDGHRRYLES
jgi:hypothetical protein